MKAITFDNMSDRLVEAVPELAQAYETELRWWRKREPGAHNIYAEILNPHLVSLLEGPNQDEVLRRIFDFVEQLARHEDERVQEVVAVTVLEHLVWYKDLLPRVESLMGPETLRMLRAIQSWKPRYNPKV